MKTKLFLLTMIVFFTKIAIAGVHPDTQSTSSYHDGEIIGILIALNKNEIAAANEALKRASSPQVKQYAKRATYR